MKVAVVKGGVVGRKLKKFMLSENKDNKNTIFKVIRSFFLSVIIAGSCVVLILRDFSFTEGATVPLKPLSDQ